MAQQYDPVSTFDEALARSKLSENEFIELTGIGPSAIYEWRRARSRLAPRWACVLANALAQLREVSGHNFTTKVGYGQAEAFLTAPYVKGTHEGRVVWRFPSMDNWMLDDSLMPFREDPTWLAMSIGQRAAYLNAPGDVKMEEFFEQTRTKIAEVPKDEVTPYEGAPAFTPDKPLEF